MSLRLNKKEIMRKYSVEVKKVRLCVLLAYVFKNNYKLLELLRLLIEFTLYRTRATKRIDA